MDKLYILYYLVIGINAVRLMHCDKAILVYQSVLLYSPERCQRSLKLLYYIASYHCLYNMITNTILYCFLFAVKKFHSFCGLLRDCENF